MNTISDWDFAEFDEEIEVKEYIRKDIIEDIKELKNFVFFWRDDAFNHALGTAQIKYLMKKYEITEEDLK